MKYSFTVLGTGSALPTVNRNPSAHLLNANGRFFLLDCGEGTQMQLRTYNIKIQNIEGILISHLHGDHYFGLIGLLNTFQLLGREKKLTIFCPIGLKTIIDIQLQTSKGYLQFPYEFKEWEVDHYKAIYEDDELTIEKFPLKHRILCCGYNFILKQTKRKINIDAVNYYNIPTAELRKIQNGADYINHDGKLISNHLLTLPLPKPIKISYCCDTAYSEDILPYIDQANLLFHEATFLEKDEAKAKATYHSTAKQAAIIAQKAKVGQLILGHFSARYTNTVWFQDEARQIFENTTIAEEGKTYS